VLANSSAARNFTTLAFTNLDQIAQLKKKLTKLDYIEDFRNTDILPAANITEIDEDLRRHLFGIWIDDNYKEFDSYKSAFKALVTPVNEPVTPKPRNAPLMLINPTNVSAINETIGAALSTVQINGSLINVIVPETLRRALFEGWEEKADVIYLLWAFAKDMEISVSMTTPNGTKYIIQPPAPPKRGKFGNGYEYIPFSKFAIN